MDVLPLAERSRNLVESRQRSFLRRAFHLNPFGLDHHPTEDRWIIASEGPAHHHNICLDFSSFKTELDGLAKAYVLIRKEEAALKNDGIWRYVRALKELDLVISGRNDGSVFDIDQKDLSKAEDNIRSYNYSDGYAANLCAILEVFFRYLVENEMTVCRSVWRRSLSSKKSMDVFSQEARAREKALIPTSSDLEIIAGLRKPIEDRFRSGDDRARLDLILWWATAILFASGMRANEVLTLPRRFMISKIEQGPSGESRKVWYTRRWTAKGGPPDLKLLSPRAAMICRRAEKYLALLTAPARRVACWLEDHPGQVPINDAVSETAPLKNSDICAVLNRQSGYKGTRRIKRDLKLAPHEDVTNRHLKKWLVNQRRDFVALPNGKQPLSKTAIIKLPEWSGVRSARLGRLIAHPVTYGDLKYFYTANGAARSRTVFLRYGVQDVELKSHQFRRLLDTVARDGGISENEIALLQGRKHPSQNRSYDFRTPNERAQDVREAIKGGNAFGWIADTYWQLPDVDREIFLESATQFAYETPMGNCLSNLAEDECPYFVSCMSGCGDFVHIKGDRRAVAGLTHHADRLGKGLQKLDELQSNRRIESQRAHFKRQLSNVHKALAIEEDMQITPGAAVKVFPERTSYNEDEDRE
mgnify:CR=1 FL=1|tara:strand:- start:529 stop:2457 length:1929 start_codon:yes stop_codon:yes gene_type:complete